MAAIVTSLNNMVTKIVINRVSSNKILWNKKQKLDHYLDFFQYARHEWDAIRSVALQKKSDLVKNTDKFYSAQWTSQQITFRSPFSF
jgi:hypothetical protein